MTETPPTNRNHTHRGRSRRFWWLLAVAAVFVIAGLLYGVYWLLYARFWIATEDAYVHGNTVPVMAKITGTVIAINVENTDFVKQGQPLVKLDATEAKLDLAHAKARLAQTVRDVHSLYKQIAQQKAIIQQRQFELRQDKRNYHRVRRLRRQNAISQEQYLQAKTAWLLAQASLQAARRKLAKLQTQTRGTQPKNHPRVKLAANAVRRAWLNLRRTIVLAPVSGYIAQRTVQVGQVVRPEQPLMAIVPLDEVWVEANFKETELARVRIGQPAIVTADFYGDDVQYHGHVVGLSPGTGSVFQLLPPQNATGNWIEIVQRIPVRIELNPQEVKEHPLRLGLSLTARINVHDTSGTALAHNPAPGPAYSTDVYQRSDARIERIIDQIIEGVYGAAASPRAEGGAGTRIEQPDEMAQGQAELNRNKMPPGSASRDITDGG